MTVLIKRNGKWYNQTTGKPFVGYGRAKGLLYNYTTDGRKVLLTKNAPSAQRLVSNWWKWENPERKGFRNGKYFPYVTANKNVDLGAGIDMSKQTKEFVNRAKLGFTPEQMNQELKQRANYNLGKVDEVLRDYTKYPDTISPQIKEGLADLRYQTGFLKTGYPKLLKAVAEGNLKGIQEESKVYFKDSKTQKKKIDKTRYQNRLDNYFHYLKGGRLIKRKQ